MSHPFKRALDLALLALTAPFFFSVTALLVLVVLVGQGRPLFFRQVRLGRDRTPFRIWKLRTMTLEQDERTRVPTPLGAVLRRHGLDELPQLMNVVTGEMSLVGPRPLTPADIERLTAKHPTFALRFGAKPGITGLSQIHNTQTLKDSSLLEGEYVERQGAVVDIGILLRTIWINIVGKRRGKLPLPQ